MLEFAMNKTFQLQSVMINELGKLFPRGVWNLLQLNHKEGVGFSSLVLKETVKSQGRDILIIL